MENVKDKGPLFFK